MMIYRAGDRPSIRVNPAYFTGSVWQDPINEAAEPARVRSTVVTFAPGARTFWHTHPLGQTLHVVSGAGLIQKEGQAIEVIRAGDSIWIPPGVKHWHGASPTTAMVHVAIHEAINGAHVEWLEQVTDEQYAAQPGTGA